MNNWNTYTENKPPKAERIEDQLKRALKGKEGATEQEAILYWNLIGFSYVDESVMRRVYRKIQELRN